MTTQTNYRIERVAQYITRELTTLLQRKVRDPRCKQVRVMHVRMSPDCAYAKVYVLFANDEPETIKEGLQGLKQAKGFLRKELAKHLSMRQTPDLQFTYDKSVPYGQHLSQLIDRVAPPDEDTLAT